MARTPSEGRLEGVRVNDVNATLRLVVSAESVALNASAEFLKWAFEALDQNVPEPRERAALAGHIRSRCLPGFGANDACRVLETRSESGVRVFFPSAQKPFDWLAMGLLCLAEQAYTEIVDDQAAPADSVRWWKLMSTIQRVEAAVGIWRAADEALHAKQKAASLIAHADGDEVRRRVLDAFDLRVGEWRNYAAAARVLYREFHEPKMPWQDQESMRRFLVRERRGALTPVKGRPRKT